jgi:hypothetical protein
MRSCKVWPGVGAVFLAACGGGGGAAAPAPSPTATLSASPTTLASGAAATLTWTSTNATACVASGGWNGNKATSGTQSTGELTAAAIYSLTCTGSGGTRAAASATVNVAPGVVLTASPATVAPGAAAVLSWSSTNATACAGSGSGAWSGSVPASGTRSTGALTANTAYIITCSGPGGSSDPANVTVNVVPTAVLAANPTVVASGGAAVLTWSSANATSCTAAGGWTGVKATSGTESTGALGAPVSYSLTCTGAGGSSQAATASVVSGTVSVVPPVAGITLQQTVLFTASVPGGGSVNWAVDGIAGGNATVGLINESGSFTPGTAPGVHTIAASSAAYPSLSAQAVAAVTDLTGVYTYHNDPARDGANTQEYALTPSTVASGSFGKLFSCIVDGAIYAQPLWVANVTVNGGQHNVVLVATEHDSVFAFDADAVPCTPLWSVSLIDGVHDAAGGETPVPSGPTGFLVGRGAGDITPEVGVTGTPVIDPATGTLYVVSKSVSAASGSFYQRLHALDLTTGLEKPGSPVTISAFYPGSGDGGMTVAFNPGQENQRGGLAFVDGAVYITWSAHEDVAPFYGWVMGYAYDGAAFTQVAVFNATPDAQRGGIWMGGGAPASDALGNLYLVTGNGDFDATSSSPPNMDYGDSLLQLAPGLRVAQYFTPSNQATASAQDLDFGAGGAAVLADLPAGSSATHLLVCGGKDGGLYVLNRDLLGGFGDAFAIQKVAFGYRIFATGAFWNSNYYLSGSAGPLSDYALSAPTPQIAVASSSSHIYGFGGSTPSVSAAGLQNGIVWSLDNGQYCTTFSAGCGPAVLFANAASNVATELWNSGSVANAAGFAVKFAVPTVANGKVYVGTRGNNTGGALGSTTAAGELDVYGLKTN